MRYLATGELAHISVMLLSVRRHFGFMLKHLTLKKLANILLCVCEMKLKRAKLYSMPFYLRVEVSSICNLRCPGCQLGRGESAGCGSEDSKHGLMSYETFRESVRDFLPYLVKVNLYDEGEPLLNPDIFEMIRHLSDNDVSTCISSNFSMPLSDEYLAKLIDSGLEHLIVPLDGASPETYNRYRVGGDFHLVVDNVHRLTTMISSRTNSRLKVEVQFIDFDNDAREREVVQGLARDLRVWRFSVVEGSSRQGWPRFEGTEEERRRRGCYQLWVTATITSNGEVGACDYGEDNGMSYLGLARDYISKDLRNHPSVMELRDSFGSRMPINKVCGHCSLYRKKILP
jgi:sulfatase maturation enzyme AslB (radical SAM superfamily)